MFATRNYVFQRHNYRRGEHRSPAGDHWSPLRQFAPQVQHRSLRKDTSMTYLALILCKISVSVTSALGLYLCTTLCGQLSLGTAGFIAIGAYIFAFFGNTVGVAAAPILLFAVTFPLGFLLLRLSGDYLAAATLGIAELVRLCLSNLSPVGGAGGMTVNFRLHPATAVVSTTLVLILVAVFTKTKTAHLCRAISMDETASRGCGVNVTFVKSLTFALSCAVCGFAGCLYAGAVGFICPNDFTFTRSCETLAAVIIGGRNPVAVMLCATALEILSALLVGFAEIKMIVYGTALLICALRRRNA